jgi:hypothetical protein
LAFAFDIKLALASPHCSEFVDEPAPMSFADSEFTVRHSLTDSVTRELESESSAESNTEFDVVL